MAVAPNSKDRAQAPTMFQSPLALHLKRNRVGRFAIVPDTASDILGHSAVWIAQVHVRFRRFADQ